MCGQCSDERPNKEGLTSNISFVKGAARSSLPTALSSRLRLIRVLKKGRATLNYNTISSDVN